MLWLFNALGQVSALFDAACRGLARWAWPAIATHIFPQDMPASRVASIGSHARIFHGSRQRCVLSVMADFAERPVLKRSVNDLLLMAPLAKEERAFQLHEAMKVGLAKCSLRLSAMPFGFCNMPSIRKVTTAYTEDFNWIMDFEHKKGAITADNLEEYDELTKLIFNKHRGTMLDIAKGVFEFYEDLERLFGKVELAEVREDLRLIKNIEESLDQFFTDRLTMRMLISHVLSLNSGKRSHPGMVGIVNTKTSPIQILDRAYANCKFICMRDYQVAPELIVNGRSVAEFLASEVAQDHSFPYVHTHLLYIFLELLKNGARASIERAQMDSGMRGELDDGVFVADSSKDPVIESLKVPSINIIVPESVEDWDRERSVKLEDKGTGMNRHVLQKAFCYFFSSIKHRPTVADEVSDFDRRAPLAGFGFGLPISRVMARYFDGNIDLNSISGKGTDVYVYL